ncbi:MAG: CBS domain-containing protein [Candidatus Micrarchaeota archaeon]|nr:CBS domain-containing protein [Candidatus Micrarchaeota archaeon]
MIIRPAVILDANELMSKAAKLMEQGVTTIIIQKNGKYIGILSDRTLKTIQYVPDAKVEKYAWKAPLLRQDDSLEKKMSMFVEGYRELPLVDGDSIIGLIKNIDVLEELIGEDKIPPMKVEEIMSVPIEKMDIKESVSKAAAKMRKEGKHHLLITENNKPVAIVSSIDITPLVQKVKTKVPMGREKAKTSSILLQTVVGSSPRLIKISPSSSLREAAKLMKKNDITSLLAEGDGKFGIITAVDIIKAAIPKHETAIEIIGLDEEDKAYKDDIYKEVNEFAKSCEQIMPIEFIRLNIKKHSTTGRRHKYTMKMLVAGRKTFDVSSYDWKLFAALKEVLREADRKIKQEKEKLKGKKSGFGKLRSISIQIQEGDLYPGKPENE